MFVNGGNPVNQSPNSNLVAEALSKLEFVVVVDSFLTDTTDYAHIFLPTTTFLEEEDALVSWGHNILGGVNPAIDPVGESRSDLWIVQQLANRLGIGSKMAGTPREWLQRILRPLENKGVTIDELMQGPIRCPVAPLIPFADGKFPTKSGRFEFVTDIALEQRHDPDFPDAGHQFQQEVAAVANDGNRASQDRLGARRERLGRCERHRRRAKNAASITRG